MWISLGAIIQPITGKGLELLLESRANCSSRKRLSDRRCGLEPLSHVVVECNHYQEMAKHKRVQETSTPTSLLPHPPTSASASQLETQLETRGQGKPDNVLHKVQPPRVQRRVEKAQEWISRIKWRISSKDKGQEEGDNSSEAMCKV